MSKICCCAEHVWRLHVQTYLKGWFCLRLDALWIISSGWSGHQNMAVSHDVWDADDEVIGEEAACHLANPCLHMLHKAPVTPLLVPILCLLYNSNSNGTFMVRSSWLLLVLYKRNQRPPPEESSVEASYGVYFMKYDECIYMNNEFVYAYNAQCTPYCNIKYLPVSQAKLCHCGARHDGLQLCRARCYVAIFNTKAWDDAGPASLSWSCVTLVSCLLRLPRVSHVSLLVCPTCTSPSPTTKTTWPWLVQLCFIILTMVMMVPIHKRAMAQLAGTRIILPPPAPLFLQLRKWPPDSNIIVATIIVIFVFND